MRYRGRRTALAAAAVALVVATLAACTTTPGTTSSGTSVPTPYKIGVLASQTGTGAAYGPQQAAAVQFAADEINAAGGIDGHPVQVIVRDDGSDPTTGARLMRDLIADQQVVAVIGPTLSIVAQQAHPVADQLRTPVIAASNTADGIVGRCDYDCQWIWRDSLGEQAAVTANVQDYVLDAAPRTAAIIQTSSDVLGNADASAAKAAFRAANVEVLGAVSLPQDETTTAVVTALLARKPDVLFLGSSYGAWVAGVMREARAAGYTGQFLAGNIMNSDDNVRLAGAAGVGTRSGAAWVLDNNFPANQQFVRAYQRATGRQPDQFDAQAYVAMQILIAALQRTDPAAEPIAQQRAAVQAALADTAISTVLGPFRFTADHDVDQIVWIVEANAQGHRLVGFCDPDCGAQ